MEGDSGADDKRLQVLSKAYLKWFSTPIQTPSDKEKEPIDGHVDEDEAATAREKLLGGFAQFRMHMKRNALVHHMNLREQRRFKRRIGEIGLLNQM